MHIGGRGIGGEDDAEREIRRPAQPRMGAQHRRAVRRTLRHRKRERQLLAGVGAQHHAELRAGITGDGDAEFVQRFALEGAARLQRAALVDRIEADACIIGQPVREAVDAQTGDIRRVAGVGEHEVRAEAGEAVPHVKSGIVHGDVGIAGAAVADAPQLAPQAIDVEGAARDEIAGEPGEIRCLHEHGQPLIAHSGGFEAEDAVFVEGEGLVFHEHRAAGVFKTYIIRRRPTCIGLNPNFI